MPGCSASVIAVASMTGSTNPGPIQPPQGSVPFLDHSFFVEEGPKLRRYAYRRSSKSTRRKMTSPAAHPVQPVQPVQLTPLWEYVVRVKKFPKDTDVVTIFDEISERLRDPEWEVRQHALRVLVDVLPTLSTEIIDDVANLVLPDLIDNLGNSAPAVRKGSLDAIRIYLMHTPRRDETTKKILQDGLNRADVLDNYQTCVARGVILSAPLLLFPSRSSIRPSTEVVRETTQALAMRLVQVTHQESALRSLTKIRQAIGEEEFSGYLRELDDSMKRNFELLCDVYGFRGGASTTSRRRSRSKATEKYSVDRTYWKDSSDVVAVSENWDNEDSKTSDIVENNEDTIRIGSGGVSSARIVLETEIKFDEETAVTMTILEEQQKEAEWPAVIESDEKANEKEDKVNSLPMIEVPRVVVSPEERRKTPRRVHFGGEVVKLRTPDSEDADSVISEAQQQSTRTRIPLPVSPATRMPSERRARSSSQPGATRPRSPRQRRSASSSPKRDLHTHDASLSPRKSILAKTRTFETQDVKVSSRPSRRDSLVSVFTPRITSPGVAQEVSERSFRIYEGFDVSYSPPLEGNVVKTDARGENPSFLGDACGMEEERTKDNLDYVFGDRTGTEFEKKMQKEHDNLMRLVNRSKSAQENTTKFDWGDEEDTGNNDVKYLSDRERRRAQSAKLPGFEVFPRQERNYILMELSSPVKDSTVRTSLEDNPSYGLDESEDKENKNADKDIDEGMKGEEVSESRVDSNERSEKEKVEVERKHELGTENDQDIVDEDIEKAALDAKERSSESSSDGESKNKELSWEELGLVDDEVLGDFHNKDDWRARVRGLEHIACALRSPSALAAVERRLGSLLHAVLGGERSCRVAAAGLAVAKVVLTGVSEETLKNRLSLIAWGLARQGGPNAAHLARLAMLKTSPGLFLEKLLQPQCIGARNAKMRENTLQLLIFSLVTFPSTEFKVKSAVDKVVGMVGDRRKRVRHAALDALAVLSQIYDSEDILEASKRFAKDKQDGQLIRAAIKTRLSRKLLPTVSMDGLVVYGLQISSNFQCSGADVDWIVSGSGSVSPGTGRTRGQLIAMSKMENNANEPSYAATRLKSKSASEYGGANQITGNVIEKNERTASWKPLPQSNQNARRSEEKQSKQIDRTSKSADLTKASNLDLQLHNEDTHEKDNKSPKRIDGKSELEISNCTNFQLPKQSDEYSTRIRASSSAPVPRQESRIPIYKGSKLSSTNMNDERSDRTPSDAASAWRWDYHRGSYLNTGKNWKHYLSNPSPASNYEFLYTQRDRTFQHEDADLQAKYRENLKKSPLQSFKDNNQRTFSYKKLSKGFDTVTKNSRAGLRSVPNAQYSSNASEMYESIYQRQHRVRKEKGVRMFEMASSPLSYEYEYEDYIASKKSSDQNNVQIDNRSSRKSQIFSSPFDNRPFKKSSETLTKDESADQRTDRNTKRILSDSACITSEEIPSPYRYVDEVRSNSGSSSSSNRSARSGRRVQSRETLPVHTESDESNVSVDKNSRASSPSTRSNDKAFDVISTKSNPSRCSSPDAVSIHTDVEEELERTSLDSPTKLSLESLLEGCDEDGPTASDLATPTSSKSSNEQNSNIVDSGRSVMELNDGNDVNLERERLDSPDIETRVKNLSLRNTTEDTKNTAAKVLRSPVRLRTSYAYDRDLQGMDSNVTLPNTNATVASPKYLSPRRFINEDRASKDTDSDETPPLPIGFDGVNQVESADSTDETDDVNVKQQSSRLQMPVDLPRRACKVSPCKTRSQKNAKRATSVSGNRPYEKHAEKTRTIQQCFEQLESNDWQVTLKGLSALVEIAKNEPEQLDICTPGLLARMLGKHVKNLRSQVARVACTAASQVFGAHIRGIEQDLDEIAGPLLHRTADTNKFLREDCNAALDSMVEHFPSHRTITTIINRGASHQNTIVHATTARLLFVTVTKIGPEHVMTLPRDVKDKLFATIAKLLTDGNLQARKHAKETFRLLSRCEGFRKTLTDSVPENTLRLIDKTLRSL